MLLHVQVTIKVNLKVKAHTQQNDFRVYYIQNTLRGNREPLSSGLGLRGSVQV